MRILGIWGISALYLGVFFTLSLLFSAIFNRPSIGLLVLLQIWIVVIVIYPNVSVILSRHLMELPGREELEDRKRALFEPYEQQYSETAQAFDKMVESNEMDMELMKKNLELNAQRTELYHRIDGEYSRQLTRQMLFARNIGLLSPSVLYDSVIQRMACTDIREFDKFMEGVERHWHKDVERAKLMYTDYKAYQEYKMPEFTYTTQSAAESLVHTLPQWIVLFLLSIVFFAGAHAVLMRKSIR
jgi:ABC-type transport system involved in multi-copper enzyme maturation permease subunit